MATLIPVAFQHPLEASGGKAMMLVAEHLRDQGYDVDKPVLIRGRLKPVVGGIAYREGDREMFQPVPRMNGVLDISCTTRPIGRTLQVERIAKKNPEGFVVSAHNNDSTGHTIDAEGFILNPHIPSFFGLGQPQGLSLFKNGKSPIPIRGHAQ